MADMREALENAYADAEEDLEKETEEDEEAGGSDDGTGDEEKDTEESLGSTGEEKEGSESESDEEEEDSTSGEDEAGESEKDTELEAERKAAAEASGRAPVSWKPAAREHWKKLPPEVHAEVTRRETEIARTLQETSDQRKAAQQFSETVRPFEPLIAAAGSTPLETVKSLMTTAAGLKMGTAQEKASIISNIISEYGVDIATLDQVLSTDPRHSPGSNGGGGAAPNADLQAMIRKEIAPFTSVMQQINQGRQQYETDVQTKAQEEMEKFSADPKNEFFEDVRGDMADLMEMAASRGEAMTLEQAYKKACAINADVSTVLDKRTKQNATQSDRKVTRRRRAAASSVKSSSSSESGKGETNTIRGAVEASIEELGG